MSNVAYIQKRYNEICCNSFTLEGRAKMASWRHVFRRLRLTDEPSSYSTSLKIHRQNTFAPAAVKLNIISVLIWCSKRLLSENKGSDGIIHSKIQNIKPNLIVFWIFEIDQIECVNRRGSRERDKEKEKWECRVSSPLCYPQMNLHVAS